MNEEIKEYIKNNLKIQIWYDDAKTVKIELLLEDESICQSDVWLPFQENEYDDYGNVK
jgi:hypothetical protein